MAAGETAAGDGGRLYDDRRFGDVTVHIGIDTSLCGVDDDASNTTCITKTVTMSRAVLAFASAPFEARFARWRPEAHEDAIKLTVCSIEDAERLDECLRLAYAVSAAGFPGTKLGCIMDAAMCGVVRGLGDEHAESQARLQAMDRLMRMRSVAESAGLDRLATAIAMELEKHAVDVAKDLFTVSDTPGILAMYHNAMGEGGLEQSQAIARAALLALTWRFSSNGARIFTAPGVMNEFQALPSRVFRQLLPALQTPASGTSKFTVGFWGACKETMLALATAWVHAQGPAAAGAGGGPTLHWPLVHSAASIPDEDDRFIKDLAKSMSLPGMSSTYTLHVVPHLEWLSTCRAVTLSSLVGLVQHARQDARPSIRIKRCVAISTTCPSSSSYEHVRIDLDAQHVVEYKITREEMRAAVAWALDDPDKALGIGQPMDTFWHGVSLSIRLGLAASAAGGSMRMLAYIKMRTPFTDAPDDLPVSAYFTFNLVECSAAEESPLYNLHAVTDAYVSVDGYAPEAHLEIPRRIADMAMDAESDMVFRVIMHRALDAQGSPDHGLNISRCLSRSPRRSRSRSPRRSRSRSPRRSRSRSPA